jgi:hypothetical protein
MSQNRNLSGNLIVSGAVTDNSPVSSAGVLVSALATASTSGVMYGLNFTFTPTKASTIVMVYGYAANNTSPDGGKISLAYGTGTPPVQGAAATGTGFGQAVQFTTAANNQQVPWALYQNITLTPGTTYWFDVQCAATTGGTATFSNTNITAFSPT